MAAITDPNGLRRAGAVQAQNPMMGGGEKFMGSADVVQPPALPGAAPSATPSVAPAAAPAGLGPGRANMMGSGSAPIGMGGVGTAGAAADAAAPGLMARGLGAARTLANGAMGKVVAGGAAAQAIGDSMADDSTDRYAKRFGVAPPTGDGSVGDIAKFVGLRAGGFASDLGNRLTMGLAGKLYQDNPGQPTAPQAAGAAPGAAIAAPTPQPTPATAQLAGSPLFGADGVRKVPGDPTLYTNAPTNAADQAFKASRGTVSTMGGGADQMAAEQRAGDLQAQISSMRAGLRDRGDTGAYLRGASQVASLQPGGMSNELQGQIDRLASSKNLTAAGVQALSSLTNVRNQAGQHAAQIAEQGREADQTAQVGLRGQDVTMQGHVMTARTAANAARLNQMNQDREYGLKNAEFGDKQQQEAFTQRENAAKNLTQNYESMFTTTDKDGKTVTDKARAAKYVTGVQNFLGTRQAELQQKVQAGQATPEEQQALHAIQTKGVAALDQEDLATIHSQMQLGERAEQTSGLLGGRAVTSSNPGDFQVVGRSKNLIGSDTLHLKGGGTMREADAKYDEPGNPILPNWLKHKTNEFDLAKGLNQGRK